MNKSKKETRKKRWRERRFEGEREEKKDWRKRSLEYCRRRARNGRNEKGR